MSTPSTALTCMSASFALNALPAFTDFTNLYDQYRIDKVRLDFYPRATTNLLASVDSYNLFHMAVDHTDITVPTNELDIFQYDNHRTVQPYKPFSLTIKPAPASTYWSGTTASGYGPRAGAWIDSKSPGVQHYGMKGVWQCNASGSVSIDCKITVWASFKEAM